MSSKSLLRHRRCVSTLDEMSGGSRFHRVIGEVDSGIAPEGTRRVVFCSGKVYYDLLAAREERGIDDVALLRLEQIAPFPSRSLMVEIAKFREAEVVWCQEEPENMGAWTFVAPRIEAILTELGGEAAPAPPRRAQGGGIARDRLPGAASARAAGADRRSPRRGDRVVTLDITVPALGESVTEATVTRWLKAEGDAVAADETLVELETDKIAVEVKAEAAGTLAEIATAEGGRTSRSARRSAASRRRARLLSHRKARRPSRRATPVAPQSRSRRKRRLHPTPRQRRRPCGGGFPCAGRRRPRRPCATCWTSTASIRPRSRAAARAPAC